VRVRLEPASDTTSWTTDKGYAVTVARAYLVTAAADLEACGADAVWFHEIRRAVSFVTTAHAHEPGTPTHIGSPYVESLVGGEALPVDYGTFNPPPDRYCMLHYDIGPADDDAEGLPADPDMVGKSFYVEGTYAGADGTVHPFTVATAATAAIEIPVSTLDLHSAGASDVVVRKSAAHWFDGIDFATAAPEATATAMLANIGASLSAVVQ
jgi:hypothetical protein